MTDDLQNLERGFPAMAEQLLEADPERTAAVAKLAQAKERFDAAEDRVDSAVAALEAIAEKLPDASDSARKKLVGERAELSLEVLHGPSEVVAAAEIFVDALEVVAVPVYRAAHRQVVRLNAEIAPLENQRGDINGLIGHKLSTGEDLRPSEEQRSVLNKQIRGLKDRRDAFATLASLAEGSLANRFGAVDGYNSDLDGYKPTLYMPHGRRLWLDSVRSRVSSRVAPWTGARDSLRPLGA